MSKKRIKISRSFRQIKLSGALAVLLSCLLLLSACVTDSTAKETAGAASTGLSIDFEAGGEVPSAVRDYATDYVRTQLDFYVNECGYEVTAARVTALTRIDTDSNLGNDVHVWRLEYRLQMKNPDEVMLAGGMRMEGGWLTESGSTGQPFLVLVRNTADDSWVRVGVTNTLSVAEDYGGDYSRAAMAMYEKYLTGAASETTTASGLPADITALFTESDSWQVTERLSATEAVLPESLMTNVEAAPTQFYWMRAVVLSESYGFDLAEQLGKPVTIEVFTVIGGKIPADFSDSTFGNPRGIVVRDQGGAVVGAFIDTLQGGAYTLTLKTFEQAAGQSLLDYWYAKYYDKTDPVNAAAEKRTVEEVIARYFDGVATGNDTEQLSTLNLRQKLDSLYINLDGNQPYNKDLYLYEYLVGVKVMDIVRNEQWDTNGLESYEVKIDAKLSEEGKQVLGQDGEMSRFLRVGTENGRICVFGDGTGP